MECLIVVVVVFGLVISLLVTLQGGGLRVEQVLRQVGRRYSGRVVAGGWKKSPRLYFHYRQEEPVTVELGKLARHNYLELRLPWPQIGVMCEVLPRHLAGSAWASLSNVAQVTMGDADFEQLYRVHGTPADTVRKLLSPAVRWRIAGLAHLQANQHVQLQVNAGTLRIRKQLKPLEFAEVDECVRLALELYDQLTLTQSEGIDFVEEGPQVVEQAVCQVCGEEITTDMVFCRRCKTPHHLECWQYIGRCSVFACDETQCVSPRIQ